MEWQPQQADLDSLVQLLKAATTAVDNTVQQQAYHQLNSFNKLGDYNNYLAYILAVPQLPPSIRATGGLILKTNLHERLAAIDPQILEFVKKCALSCVGDPQQGVRNAAGSIITTVVAKDLGKWPDILPRLMEMVQSPDQLVVEGSFSALEKICQDSAHLLERDPQQPLNYMIPKFIQFFSHDNPKVRASAIHCVNQFATPTSQAVMANMEAFVDALYKRANDSHSDVRKYVCQALVSIMEARPEALLPQLDNVVSFMLYCTQESDEVVALEACEFWLAFAEQPGLRDNLEPYLSRIIPVLLKGMVYNEDDIMELGCLDDDANVPDKEEDIKPRHHKVRSHTHAHEGGPGAAGTPVANGEDSDDDDFFDDDNDDDVYTKWSLRKCSAAALDVIATMFGDELLIYLIPKLKEELFHAQWEHREAGILALGAVAEGCPTGMEPHLPQLVPHLLQTLNDQQPLVRAITCWTLSRYAKWIVYPTPIMQLNEQQIAEHRRMYFQPLLEGLSRMVQDNNKRVQEAGCSALATVEEEAGGELVPYLEPILRTLTYAFNKYQRKNLLILYDAIGTLAEAVGGALNEQKYIEILMAPLNQKWSELPDNSRDIFPLLECMSSVATALGTGFTPFAPVVWNRCLGLVSSTLQQIQMYQANAQGVEEPDKDFMVVALDLLSGMAQGLNTSVEPLVAHSNPSIVTLLSVCIKDPTPEVRQSAYALLGDLAISAFVHIRPHLNTVFMPELISQIDPTPDEMRVSVCNNATWAAGEIALKYEGEMGIWVEHLLPRLIILLTSKHNQATLKENAAITIGRLGYVCPEKVAPELDKFLQVWCHCLCEIRDNLEKESAFQGICRIIEASPERAAPSFVYFCDAVVRWKRISPELNERFRSILTNFKGAFGAQWDGVMAGFPVRVRDELQRRYGL
ncbi:hypothetical protein HK104_010420 [Borealophlyctis nickersoniae]|nr:hypothetical protein HK104_010420 [Borealophlyctis nickersoniae]